MISRRSSSTTVTAAISIRMGPRNMRETEPMSNRAARVAEWLRNQRGEVMPATLRTDLWWLEQLLVIVVLGGFGIYATWAALQNAHYYAAPYLSPFYSPCLSANCK